MRTGAFAASIGRQRPAVAAKYPMEVPDRQSVRRTGVAALFHVEQAAASRRPG